jgi:hypothetical protein
VLGEWNGHVYLTRVTATERIHLRVGYRGASPPGEDGVDLSNPRQDGSIAEFHLSHFTTNHPAVTPRLSTDGKHLGGVQGIIRCDLHRTADVAEVLRLVLGQMP